MSNKLLTRAQAITKVGNPGEVAPTPTNKIITKNELITDTVRFSVESAPLDSAADNKCPKDDNIIRRAFITLTTDWSGIFTISNVGYMDTGGTTLSFSADVGGSFRLYVGDTLSNESTFSITDSLYIKTEAGHQQDLVDVVDGGEYVVYNS